MVEDACELSLVVLERRGIKSKVSRVCRQVAVLLVNATVRVEKGSELALVCFGASRNESKGLWGP